MRLACVGLMLVAAAAIGGEAVPAPQAPPTVYRMELDGIIHPVATAYVRKAIAQADAAEASLLVIVLRTPGGLVDSTRDINSAIIEAKTPVAVFVAPAGSRAASAGFLITMAADVAAMAPGTHIGAAHPVSGDGQKVDDTMARKMASDVAGYARTIAQQRHRNVSLVELAVTESRTFTEQEALASSPPLIDLVATDVPDLLKKLDGRAVARFDGRRTVLRTAGAVERTVAMSWTQRVLSAVAHPQIAYLLLMLGTLGLTVEMWSPGAIFPGVVGGISLLLAFFAFQVLPVNSVGILLILFGLFLLILEIKVTSFGLLGAGGVLSLFFGSILLVDSPLPELQLGLRWILPVTLSFSAILLFLVRLAVKAQQIQPVTGQEGMTGEAATALTALTPGVAGRVRTRGEIWSATASEPINAGEPLRIVEVRGLQLVVAPDRSGSRPADRG